MSNLQDLFPKQQHVVHSAQEAIIQMMREYPNRPIVACHAVIQRGNEILLTQRGSEPGKGLWSIPGGVVELGETLHEALRREVQEETGLEIEVKEIVGYNDNIIKDEQGHIRFHYVNIFFRARAKRGRVQAASDATDAQCVPLYRLKEYNLSPGVIKLFEELGLL